MRKNKKTIIKILTELEKTGLVSSACSKIGMARSTYYRWYNSDIDFRFKADEAIDMGRKNMVDFAESKIIENINSGDQRAAEFYLRHNDSRYQSNYSRALQDAVNNISNGYRKDFEFLKFMKSLIFDTIPIETMRQIADGKNSDSSNNGHNKSIDERVNSEVIRIIGLKYYKSIFNNLKTADKITNKDSAKSG